MSAGVGGVAGKRTRYPSLDDLHNMHVYLPGFRHNDVFTSAYRTVGRAPPDTVRILRLLTMYERPRVHADSVALPYVRKIPHGGLLNSAIKTLSIGDKSVFTIATMYRSELQSKQPNEDHLTNDPR